ncbi:hypothetical protein T06_15628 [Trichinella sp. T6]|nr:hypothetical protein T06_15628 [Trichinella sp. T6]
MAFSAILILMMEPIFDELPLRLLILLRLLLRLRLRLELRAERAIVEQDEIREQVTKGMEYLCSDTDWVTFVSKHVQICVRLYKIGKISAFHIESSQLHHCSQLRHHPKNLLPHESRTPDHQHACSPEFRSLLQKTEKHGERESRKHLFDAVEVFLEYLGSCKYISRNLCLVHTSRLEKHLRHVSLER